MKNKRGFSLMELIMMIAVGAVLFIGTSRAVHTQIKKAIELRNYMIALNLARQKMAVMNNAACPAVGTTTPAADGSFSGFTFSQVVTSIGTSGTSDICNQVRMDVLKGTDVIVRLYTYCSNLVSFGDGKS